MRTTNLLQSYYNSNPVLQQYNSDKTKHSFDVHKELANRTFIKPLPSNGHLVRNTLFDMPGEFFRDVKYDLKALKHAIGGKANDNELGKVNDIGMKAGGLAIATALYSMNKTPLTKVMEFVGLTTFFAAMDIWPKLALQFPARLIHGFDIRQKYRDNYGTKKPVFQDHQFIPWDLYSDEEINKIGDRLRVPKDMKNRRDFIQEKMRKIALQNNTMWMLTAGFATPIMSALICNALEKPINNYQDNLINDKAEKLVEKLDVSAKKFPFNSEALEKLLTENTGRPITEELLIQIKEALSDGLDPITERYIEKDLRHTIMQDGFNFGQSQIAGVRQSLQNGFKKLGLENIEEILPSIEELQHAFSEKGLNASENVTDFSGHIKALYDLMDSKIGKINNPEIIDDLQFALDELTHGKHGEIPEIFKSLSSMPATILSDEVKAKLSSLSEILNTFKSRNMVIDHYAYLKAAQAPETGLANTWNNISGDLLKLFNFRDEEITRVRHDRIFVGNLLREKFEHIASNDTLYSDTIKSLLEKLNYLENRTEFADINKWDKEQNNNYKRCVDTTFKEASKALDNLGMHNTARRLVGFEDVDPRSLKDLKLSFMIDRVKGVKSSFYRLLNALDLYHRISKVENVDALSAGMPRQTKEALVEMCKQLLISGHSSDYAVKFYFPVNLDQPPHFANQAERDAYFAQIETKDGKVINRAFNMASEELVDNAYDKHFYESAMKLMYENELHPDTENVIKSSSKLFDNFKKYRRDIIDFIGGDHYFAKTTHKVEKAAGGGSSELRFLLMGATPDIMIKNLCTQTFNGRKWLKTFGISGAALLGITTLSQFFMGKMKKEGN